MSRRALKTAFVGLLLFTTTASESSEAKLEKFAEELKAAIVSRNSEKLRSIACYPNPDQCFDEYLTDYLYKEINDVLTLPRLKIRVFGPSTYEPSLPNSTYSLVYFDSKKSLFQENGFMKLSLRESEWNKGYAETLVSIINGKIYLHRTLFFHGAHVPWAEDY